MERKDILKATSGGRLFLSKTIPLCLTQNKLSSTNWRNQPKPRAVKIYPSGLNLMKVLHGLCGAYHVFDEL